MPPLPASAVSPTSITPVSPANVSPKPDAPVAAPLQSPPHLEPATPKATASKSETPADGNNALQTPAQSDSAHRPLPPDMLATMLKRPSASSLGASTHATGPLANAYDRAQRLAITHAYWRLTSLLAEHSLCAAEHEHLRQLQVRPNDTTLLRTAQVSAEASLRAAEVAVVAAQYDLAEAAGLPGQESLPLPVDLPHVGPYRTNFEIVAARQVLPPRSRLIDRMLPIRRQSIDVWASAVQAAEDAAQAINEAYQEGATDLATVLEYTALLGRRQRSFMTSVCDYNHDIADYAIAVAGPEIAGPALVAMLIKTNHQTSPRSTPAGSGGQNPLRGKWEPLLSRPASNRPSTSSA